MKRLTIPELAIKIGTDKFDDHDLLGRATLAHQLSELIDSIEDPLVIALDGGWGSGKSVFLKLWVGEHQKEGGKARLIYFDAFEHDFLDDPLVGLVGAISACEGKSGKKTSPIKSLRTLAWKLAKPAARIGLAAATSGVSEVVGGVGDRIAGALSKETEATMEQFWAGEDVKREAMGQFRKALAALTKPSKEGVPSETIVLIIDELDRCRPDYALSMLETIKHFFAVDGVHFVLGANMRALENSVNAQYGSGINAHEYLQKFVHLTVGLPRLKSGAGSPSLVYFPKAAKQMGIAQNLEVAVFNYLSRLVLYQEFSLRDVERLLTQVAVLSNAVATFGRSYSSLLVGALFLKIIVPAQYDRLLSSQLNINDVVAALFGGFVPSETADPDTHWLADLWGYSLNRNPDSAEVDRGQDKFGLGLQRPAGTLPRTLALEHLETFTLPSDLT